MYKNERENEILSFLNESKYSTVEYLAEKLHISSSSIRRDLKLLENRGLVKRSYGGVELANSVNKVIPFPMRSHENVNEKKKIARKAASLIQSGDVVYLDSSSSTFFMVNEIASIKNITVITNGIDSLYNLAQFDVKTICTGGTVSKENNAALANSYAESIINNIHADYVFFSAQAINSNGDIYDCYESEVFLRRIMIKNATKSVFLADGSKFNKSSVYFQENLKNTDYVITDLTLDTDFMGRFENTQFLTV